MTQPGLIVAIVASGIFGTALLWLSIYYLHRYIHKQCLELDHWFHWHAKREDYSNQKANSVSGSPPRRGRSPQDAGKGHFGSKERHSRSRRRYRSPRDSERGRRGADTFKGIPRTRPRDEESSTESPRESPKQRPRARPMETIERRWERPPPAVYYPPPPPPPQAYQPRIETPIWPQQIAVQMPPPMAMPMQYQMFAPAVASVVFPVTYNPGYEQQYAEPCEQEPTQSPSDERAEIDQHSTKVGPRIIDFIMECDELPPMLRKAPPSPHSSDEAPSGDEIDVDDDDEIQQVPRAYIPRSVPRAAVPSYPQTMAVPQSSFWNMVPAPVPERRTRKVRYAPYVKAVGQRRRLKNADKRRIAPIFEMYKSPLRRRSDNNRAPHTKQKVPILSERSQLETEDVSRHNEEPRMEQGEAEDVNAPTRETVEQKNEEARDHVDAEEHKPEAPFTEEAIYAEQDEPQQYLGTEAAAPEPEMEVETMEENKIELERQPILPGLAPFVPEEAAPQPAPASSQGTIRSVPASPATAPASSRGMPASPSSLIASLHRSDVIRWGRGSRRSSDVVSRGTNAYGETGYHAVEEASERTSSEALMGRSAIMSSLEGWAADDLERRDGW